MTVCADRQSRAQRGRPSALASTVGSVSLREAAYTLRLHRALLLRCKPLNRARTRAGAICGPGLSGDVYSSSPHSGMLACAWSDLTPTECACSVPWLQAAPPLATAPLLAMAGSALAANIATMIKATARTKTTRLNVLLSSFLSSSARITHPNSTASRPSTPHPFTPLSSFPQKMIYASSARPVRDRGTELPSLSRGANPWARGEINECRGLAPRPASLALDLSPQTFGKTSLPANPINIAPIRWRRSPCPPD